MQARYATAFGILILFIVATAGVSAFDVEVTAINNTVLPLESATYLVSISDAEIDERIINIRTEASSWILTPQTINLRGNDSLNFNLTVTPKSGVSLSNYLIPLEFEALGSGAILTKNVFLTISLDLFTKGYTPYLDLEVTMEEQVDPREPFEIEIFLKNKNLREFEELVITLESDLFSRDITTPLGALATFRKSFVIDLESQQSPGAHEVSVLVKEGNNILAQDHSAYEIIGYATVTPRREMRERGLFTSVEAIILTNDGNKVQSKPVKYDMKWREDLFTKASVEPIVVKEFATDAMGDSKEVRRLTWEVTLQPQETMEILLMRNYWPLVIAILAVILIIIAYFLFRSPILALKEAQITAEDKEGTSEMKVRIFLKNRSRSPVTNIQVIDRVPHIAELLSHAHLGTLQPTKVTKSEKRGTIARWEIDALEPYEERIISYKIKSKLKIIGRMSLPETKVKFESHGHERVTRSSSAIMVQ